MRKTYLPSAFSSARLVLLVLTASLAASLVTPFSPSAQASAASDALTKVFVATFESGYTPNRCGQNVLQLATAGRQKGIDMRDARIWRITHSGGSELDQVPAMHARNAGGKDPSTGKRISGPSRWVFFHAVLELDGYVFDFDFTNEPRVLPAGEYLQTMFIPPNRAFYERHKKEINLLSAYPDYEGFVKGMKKDLVVEILRADRDDGAKGTKLPLGELMDRHR